MTRAVRLMRVSLSYRDGLVLHTATSGSVPALDELRLVAERDGEVEALGATRLNIEYLTGIPPERLRAVCEAQFDVLDWSLPWRDLTVHLSPDLPGPARMLFEMAAADGAARSEGVPLARWLGGTPQDSTHTNQTLFLSDDATLMRRARAYVERGFLDLKLRIGAGAAADDLRRARMLRDALGEQLVLSADANGRWTEAETPALLGQFADLGLQYIEQPLPAGDWDAIGRVARAAPLPVMLDESLSDLAAVETLRRGRAAPLAHLKLAKLGGLDRLMQAGRALQAAGIGLMVGQMNEGSVSTLAAAHAAVALQAVHRELYGADGLLHDPAGTLTYVDGHLLLPPGPGLGLGLAHYDTAETILREQRV